MIRHKEWRLRTTLVVLLAFTTLATLATLLAVGGGLLLWRLPKIHQENLGQVRHEARQLAERMEIMLGGLQRQLELAGATLAQLPQNPPAVFLDALTAEGQSFEAIYLADRNGIVEAVSLGPESLAHRTELLGSDLSVNRLFRLAMQRKAAVWSNKFLSALSGDVTVGIAIPVGSGVLIGELSLAELLRALDLAARDSRLSTWVIDRRGELVAETGPEPKLGPVNLLGLPAVRAALEGSPLPDTVTIQGVDFYPAVARSDMADWLFLVRMPAGLHNPDIRFTALLVVVALFGSLLIGTLLAPLFADRISRPMRAITGRARQIADGTPSGAWPRGPIAELNTLALDLERMANHLHERQDQLREAQRIARIGSWEHTLGSDSVTWSEGLYLILRRDVSLGPPTFPGLSRFYAPESWERLRAAIAKAIDAGVPYELELEMVREDGMNCWTTTRGEAVRGPGGTVVKLRGTVHDITARKRAEELIQANNDMLEGVTRVQREFLVEADPHQRFDQMLALLLKTTASEYGFIGEVLRQPGGQPYLKTYAITNIAWNAETSAFFAENAPAGLEFYNLNSLFGAVMTTRETVIANDPAHDPRRGGLPSGHPPLRAFLGIPFFHGDQMIGMVGLSNRVGGYDQALVETLAPILATCSSLVLAQSLQRERKLGEEKLRSALAEKEVLLKEIYHRVKNNMQVVSSLLHLQSRRVADAGMKQILDDSASRVKSMALVHEQLYGAENLSSIRLTEYLQQLAGNLVNVNRPLSTHVLLRVESEELSVGVESAIPLGLVVNELVSNAYRHGYQSAGAGGEIVVRVTGLPGGQIRLEVIDDGCGLPADFEPGKGGSLGMQLVATLSEQLGGELTWDAGHPGARFALKFKPEILATRRAAV